MKQYEYIQLVKISQKFEFELSDEILYAFEELTRLHKKYQDELEYFLLYPNMNMNDGLAKARGLVGDIVQLCKTHDIDYEFEKVPKENWIEFKNKFEKSRQFVRYGYNGKVITDFIVFVKPKKADELVQSDAEVDANDLNFEED